MQEITQTYAHDIPDPRDISLSDIIGSISEVPKSLKLDTAPLLDQGNTMYCTAFSACNAINENNASEYAKAGLPYLQTRDGWDLSKIGVKAKKLDPKLGGAINWVFPYMRSMGDISGWATVERTIGSVIQALIKYGPLLTGSNTIDWSRLSSSGWVVRSKGTGYGHAFCLCGYDNDLRVFYAKNSFWDNWGKDGMFEISYDIVFDVLFTIYATVQTDDMPKLLWIKAKNKGFTDGSRPNDSITRWELATVLGRMLGKWYDPAGKLVQEWVWNGSFWEAVPSLSELYGTIEKAGFVTKKPDSTKRIDVIYSLLS